MKILITGCTATQVCSQKRIVKYTSYPEIYSKMLEKAGHTVTSRPVTPGEDLKEFHRVIIGLAPVNALNTRHMFGALWALHLLDKGMIRGCVQMDDWNYRIMFSGARSMAKDFNKRLYDNPVLLRESKEAVRDTPKLRKPIERIIETIGDDFASLQNVNVIVSLLEKGDRSQMLSGTTMRYGQLLPVDVLAGYPWKELEADVKQWKPVKRRRAWIHAALPANKGFAERLRAAAWPIEHYGPSAPDRRKLTEDKLIEQYWEVEGLIAMPYYHAGSGWCRARFVHAAVTKTVIACVKKEGEVIGPSYIHTMKEIEVLKPQQLRELAEAQSKELHKAVWLEKQLIEVLDNAVRRS